MSTTRRAKPERDPVLAAVSRAPVVEAGSEEVAAFEEGLAEIAAGRTVAAEQMQMLVEEIARGIEAANEGRFASADDVRRAFAKWGVSVDAEQDPMNRLGPA